MSLPTPTDDELLHYFVDECPNSTVQDYIRRNNMWHIIKVPAEEWDVYREEIRQHFESEWEKRKP